MANPLADLRRRVLTMIGRGLVKVIQQSGSAHRLQVELLPGELRGLIDHVQPFGSHSVPLQGAEAIVAFPGGNRGEGLAMVRDTRHAPTDLKPGEYAIYDAFGQRVHLRADGSVAIKTSGRLVVEGDLEVTGDVSDGTSSMQAMRDAYNGHNHPGASGPPTVPMQ